MLAPCGDDFFLIRVKLFVRASDRYCETWEAGCELLPFPIFQ